MHEKCMKNANFFEVSMVFIYQPMLVRICIFHAFFMHVLSISSRIERFIPEMHEKYRKNANFFEFLMILDLIILHSEFAFILNCFLFSKGLAVVDLGVAVCGHSYPSYPSTNSLTAWFVFPGCWATQACICSWYKGLRSLRRKDSILHGTWVDCTLLITSWPLGLWHGMRTCNLKVSLDNGSCTFTYM